LGKRGGFFTKRVVRNPWGETLPKWGSKARKKKEFLPKGMVVAVCSKEKLKQKESSEEKPKER